ncbi:MAG: hypothetical protein H8D78_12935 [Chloroflexi bacterium]|nr:hypothetical protein [Chloroflexota bacterium]
MNRLSVAPDFQTLIETVESLPLDEQDMLIEIIRSRVIQQRRADLAAEIAKARDDFRRGDVRRGTAADVMAELAH